MRLIKPAKAARPAWPVGKAALILLALTLVGCIGLRASGSSALPSPSELECCWQSQERVRISAHDRELTFLTALAVTPDCLTVVVLDDLGRRLLTLIHDGGSPQLLDAPPEWPDAMPQQALAHQLLLAIYLHQLTPDQWQAHPSGWVATEAGHSRTLSYRGRERVRLHYAAIGDDVAVDPHTRPRRIDYVGHDIQLDILTLSRTAL